MSIDGHVDPEAVNEDDAWLALHERPADRGAADLHAQQRAVTRRLGLAVLADVEPAGARDRERVHEVHALLAERLEQTLHHGRAQWLRVDLEQLTGVVELDAAGPLIEELRRERPEALSETHPRAAARLIGRWTWGVHRVARGFAVDDVEHLTDDIHGDVHLRLARRARDVRRKDSARRVAQRRIRRERLGREHVEGRAGDRAGSERFRKRLRVDDLASRGVHEHGCWLHLRQRLRVDNPTGPVGEWG